MKDLHDLLQEVENARQNFISVATGLTHEQENFKPSADEWSIVNNVEHMVWAELGGLNGIFQAIEAKKRNQPLWSGENLNFGLSIEEIIDNTWQKKEKVPESAKPRWGGPVEYWAALLQNCQGLLFIMKEKLIGLDFEKIIYPHPISGPLNIRQRMEFLRFHLERHQRQIENIKAHPDFPR